MSADRIVAVAAATGGVRDRILQVLASVGPQGVKDRILSVTASASPSPAPATYTVNSGAARSVEPFSTVTLSATSTGIPDSWLWDQISGPDVQLTGSDDSTATFVAPPSPPTTQLVFRVYGQTAGLNPATADVTITVYPHTMHKFDGQGGLIPLVLLPIAS